VVTVISGDMAYNNIHMWVRGSTPDRRVQWLAALDSIDSMMSRYPNLGNHYTSGSRRRTRSSR
jgi:hypothetical protein